MKAFRTPVLLTLCVLLLAACNLPQIPTQPPTLVPTITPRPRPSDTPQKPSETPTLDLNADNLPGVEMVIEGSDLFRAQAIRSLEMYRQCAPEALDEADIYIEKIEEYDRSGMDVDTGSFQASMTTAFPEGYDLEVQVYWFGGSIIHDARHRWQHLNGINTDWGAIDLAGRESIESDARGVQIAAMETCLNFISQEHRSQAEYLLNYLKDMQSGKTPCDYCKVDYQDRDW